MMREKPWLTETVLSLKFGDWLLARLSHTCLLPHPLPPSLYKGALFHRDKTWDSACLWGKGCPFKSYSTLSGGSEKQGRGR